MTIDQFIKRLDNWNELPQNVQAFIQSCETFIAFTQEVLLYKNNKIVASCTTWYIDGLEIEDCWTKDGNIWV